MPPDDFESVEEEFQDGFTWSCCEKEGSVPNCKTGRHRPEGALEWKGLRYGNDNDQNDYDTATDPDSDEVESDQEDDESGSESTEAHNERVGGQY